jgi:hypothetical protein
MKTSFVGLVVAIAIVVIASTGLAYAGKVISYPALVDPSNYPAMFRPSIWPTALSSTQLTA